MRDGVTVWTEETVKQYAWDFIHGNDMERLFGYYDLQIRRYMPEGHLLGDADRNWWLTATSWRSGTYSSFEERSRNQDARAAPVHGKAGSGQVFHHKNERATGN
jgi:hypothetical protein